MQAQQLPDFYYLTDLLLFFCMLASCMAVFGILHYVALRLHDPKRLLVFLSNVYFLSAAIVVSASYLLISDQFSNPGCYLVSVAGVVVSGFFAAGLYIFLGPSTADRSLTAHLIVFLHGRPGKRCSVDEIFEFCNARDFIEKRLQECSRAGIVHLDDGEVALTNKGNLLAVLYDASLRSLKLSSRKQFRFSFSESRSVEPEERTN